MKSYSYINSLQLFTIYSRIGRIKENNNNYLINIFQFLKEEHFYGNIFFTRYKQLLTDGS